MKNKIKLLIAFCMLFAAYSFGQDSTGTGTPTTGGIPAIELFASIPGLILLTTIISGWLTAHVSLPSTLKQIVSWAVGIGLAFLGQWKGLGIFATADTITTVSIGIGTSMVSNGLFDAGTLDNILGIFLAKKKTTPGN